MAAVGDLIINVGSVGDSERIDANSHSLQDRIRYNILAATTDLALRVHESPQGKAHLVTVGKKIVNGARQHNRGDIIIYNDSEARFDHWVGFFLDKLRKDFPVVYLEEGMEDQAEAFVRRKKEYNVDRLEDFKPKRAATLHIHRTLVDNMVHAQGQKDKDGNQPQLARNTYEVLKFQMIIVIAHEIVHYLTSFLLGRFPNGDVCLTPPGLTVPRYEDSEAGRYWELTALGGLVEFWAVKNHKLGNRQSGEAYVFVNTRDETPGSRVCEAHIRDINSGCKQAH
ncbi:hypothetical protein MAPG_11445 [Magnaporthiopsis poae ATCC 64411]|uniref:Uncharacterized protein n=1 Tax=Magnaporthiopsis poae (strain ATCC 64411 / 73-15) TaxID=644358 RepID=A0A0C4EFA6_MAGP6|nr:hypothetical protein MAPG_11445 [Magnaporthiopsis poae ATCC 64411]